MSYLLYIPHPTPPPSGGKEITKFPSKKPNIVSIQFFMRLRTQGGNTVQVDTMCTHRL